MGKNALAFVAGLGSGYLTAQQRQKEQERQDKLDKIQTDRAGREQTEFDQRRADNQTLRDAARPANVQEGAGGMLRPDTMDNRDVGLPENADLPNGGLSPQAFRVNGQGYDAQAPALAAAKKYNSPESLRTRQAAAFDQIGRPDQAMSLQSAQTAQKLHTLQLGEAEQAAVKQKFLRDAGAAISQGGHVGAADFLTKSKADGNDYKAEKDENGNIAYYQVNRETGQARHVATFDDSEKGRMDAFSMLAASVSPEHMVAHYKDVRDFEMKQAEAKRKAAESEADIKAKGAQENYHNEQAAWLKRDKGKGAGAAQPQNGLTLEHLNGVNKELFKVALDTLNPKDAASPQERQQSFEQAQTLASAGTNIYRHAYTMGVPIMQSEALTAARLATDNKNIVGQQAIDGNTYLGVMIGKKFVPTGGIAAPAPKAPAQPQTPYGKAAAAAQADKVGGTILLTPGVGKGYTQNAPAVSMQSVAAQQAPQAAAQDGFTGIEGLSEQTLRRMAADPTNPRSAIAAEKVQRIEAERRAANAARVADDQFNPAYYGGQ